jgi:hypothetical protein
VGRTLAVIRIDLHCGASPCTTSVNSFLKAVRDVAGRGAGLGGSPLWKNARVVAGAWGVGSGTNVCFSGEFLGDSSGGWRRGRKRIESPLASFRRGFRASGCNWQYRFMGGDLQRLPRLLIVQPRILPRELLKANLMEAMRLVDSLEELRGSDAPVEVKEKQRQSPFVLVQSPRSRSKRVSAGNSSPLPHFPGS